MKLARSENEVLEDPSVKLVVSAAIPDERAPLGIRVMQHGQDCMGDKPGVTTLEQLADRSPVSRRFAQGTRGRSPASGGPHPVESGNVAAVLQCAASDARVRRHQARTV